MYDLFYHWFGLNKTLFIQINQIMNLGFLPSISLLCKKIFDIKTFAGLYITLLVYLWYLTRAKNYSYEKCYNILYQIIRIGLIYGSIVVIYTLIKYTFKMPRPYCSIEEFLSVQSFIGENCFVSFPSSHTAMAVLVAYLLFPYVGAMIKMLLCAMVIFVGCTRIGLGMHYPVDVGYSIVIALSICKLVDNFLIKNQIFNNILRLFIAKFFVR